MSFLLAVPYTVPEYSGSGINAFNFGRFLTNEGIQTTILTLNRRFKYPAREIKENVNIRRVLYFNQNLFTKILSLLFIIPAYLKYILKSNVILVYGGHLFGYEFILTVARWMGKKVIFQSLLVDVDDIKTIILNKPKFLTGLYKRLFSRIDAYHSINQIFTKRYNDLLNNRDPILELAQGIDLKYFAPVSDEIKSGIRKQLGINENIWIILSVGFIIPRKGFSGIFEALKELDFRYLYIIAGEYDFPEKHFLNNYVTEASDIIQKGKTLLGDKLLLPGPVRDIHKYYHIADLIVFNSIQEGLPNSLLEAMACGLPVVTRNIPGLDGFILDHGKNCFIFNNETELRECIRYLYTNKDIAKETGFSAYSFVRDKASFQNVLASYSQRLSLTGFQPEQTT